MYRFASRVTRLAILVGALSFLAPPANAGPASDIIGKLNTVFIDVMQNTKSLGYENRYEKLQPTLAESYDFAEMTRVATGRHWRRLTDDQKQQLVAAFHDLSIATYAARSGGFGDGHFEILGEETAPAGSVRVNNQIVPVSGEPVRIDYLLRQTAGQWRIIDVYLQSSVSELAVRRGDFTGILAKRGFDGLLADIKAKVSKLRSDGAGTSS